MSPLEKMDDFFAVRVDGYDEHMMSNVERASDFYVYTASLLPKAAGSKVLDLGCGTGLELEEYFGFNPQAKVTGIDLSEAMLNALKDKFPEKDLTLVQASYFDVPLGENVYDAAVSVESLHHFKDEMKESLYRKLRTALKTGGTFVLTDCFAESDELEKEYFETLARLKKEQGLSEDEFYHFDTPLTVEHEMDVLRRAGFRDVRIDKRWSEKTCTVLATV
ncbi:class I SAM-dependent methyltransferase [Clostridiales bacterium FE2010]|nr:class I SAM-dependent methyltransferase [Clostridiales bacterium FE2010]